MISLPHASEEFKKLNPQIFSSSGVETKDGVIVRPQTPNESERSAPWKTKRGMNKTEHAFSLILESRKGRMEIHSYFYEGITLKWGDCMKYTPDFVVYPPIFATSESGVPYRPKLIEIKGGFIRDRDTVRFKGCRAEWKDYYDFELWQKKAGNWRRLL